MLNPPATVLTALAGCAVIGYCLTPVSTVTAAPAPVADTVETVELIAKIRDFKAYNESGGHDDFQRYSGSTRVGLVDAVLGADGVPVLGSQTGSRIITEYRDSGGNNINPALYDPDRGDIAGSVAALTDARIYSESSFLSWYRDTPGVNLSTSVTLTLNRVGDTDVFVFDSNTDPMYAARGGFFPIDDELFGNYITTGKNFHFTTEVRTEFNYQAGEGYRFKFTGDDDVWVYIDGRLVVDMGSLHSVREQSIELDRLDWLVNGRNYELVIFHAERRTTASNFRIETTIPLAPAEPPSVTAAFD